MFFLEKQNDLKFVDKCENFSEITFCCKMTSIDLSTKSSSLSLREKETVERKALRQTHTHTKNKRMFEEGAKVLSSDEGKV